MSSAADKITVACPQCGQDLNVPASAIGKHGRCPSCQHVFPLEAALPATVIEPPPPPNVSPAQEDQDYDLQPLPPGPTPNLSTGLNPYAPPAAQTSTRRYEHGFGWEHRGWDAGMMGGLGMMAVAVIWFFGGMAFNVFFPYPLVLFVIGLVGFFRGMFTGNVSGRD